MIFRSIFARKTLALCLGSFLMGASSAYAVEATPRQSSEQSALVETLPAPAPAERVIVEGTGPYGVDAQGVKRHLAASLKTDAGLFPRTEVRTFFNGDVKMNYQVARPAIDRPFGDERAIVELRPVMSAVDRAVRAVFAN
ncbi:hypothetical protein NU688_24535 [Variovorax sp. ZS18.2.2]|uniref:hypothetical protein n=1 Tax=Variovorax sp. ZS18.2.2 TaxID=2971255 RepID=UPI00215106F1|nr:hypothetical protein [Variovorax sp. ZS18.2.2]MCR6479348.1 hypothetical protein [Variovorax sp. ZS18.2.2]